MRARGRQTHGGMPTDGGAAAGGMAVGGMAAGGGMPTDGGGGAAAAHPACGELESGLPLAVVPYSMCRMR
jgi:hypothetical protein